MIFFNKRIHYRMVALLLSFFLNLSSYSQTTYSTYLKKKIENAWKHLQQEEEKYEMLLDSIQVNAPQKKVEIEAYKKHLKNVQQAKMAILGPQFFIKKGDTYQQNDTITNLPEFQRLCFFELTGKEDIAELGAGQAYPSLRLGLLFDSLTIYINEISEGQIGSIKRNIKRRSFSFTSKNVQAVLGTPKSTGLENKNLDLIFVINSFHHFEYYDEMYASITASLKQGGLLIIEEEFASPELEDQQCSELLSRQAYARIMKKFPATKIAELYIPSQNKVLLKYRIDRQ